MILHDPYALHRKWWNYDWKPELGDDSWTEWDYILAEVYQVIEDYTDSQTGQWMPYDQSGEVHWDVQSSFSGSAQAIQLAQKARGELKPGESLYAVPVFDNPDNKPTLSTWIQDIDEQKADLRPVHARDARPPTPEELRELKKASESAKLEE